MIAIILIATQMILINYLLTHSEIDKRKVADMMTQSEFAEVFETFEKDMTALYHKVRYDKLQAEDYLHAKHYKKPTTQMAENLQRKVDIRFHRAKHLKKA